MLISEKKKKIVGVEIEVNRDQDSRLRPVTTSEAETVTSCFINPFMTEFSWMISFVVVLFTQKENL